MSSLLLICIVTVGCSAEADDADVDVGSAASVLDFPAGQVIQKAGADSGRSWELRYAYFDDSHCISFVEDDQELFGGCGMRIPDVTEIGFDSRLKPGEGKYYLVGLTSSRIATIEARSVNNTSKVATRRLEPEGDNISGLSLRSFVIVRQPVDDVDRLVGLDADGRIVQSIELKPPSDSDSGATGVPNHPAH